MERTLNALRRAGWKVAQHLDRSDGRVQWTMTHPDRGPVTIEADSDTEALTDILKKAGISPAEKELHDNGPWVAGVEDGNHSYLQSEDFTHDARLYVTGAFATTDDALDYARNLAVEMNAMPKVTPPAERGVPRIGVAAATVVQSLWDRKALRVAGGMIVVLLVLAAITAVAQRRPDPLLAEAHADAYRDARTALETCPAIASAIHESIADGRITVGEAQQLHEFVQQASSEYQSDRELAIARKAIGLKAYPLPPRCIGTRPRAGDDAGPPTDLFQDYEAQPQD